MPGENVNDIIAPGSATEGSEDKGDKMAIMRADQTERLMKNLSRLSLAFGLTIVLGLGGKQVMVPNGVGKNEIVTFLGILIGAFMVGAAVTISVSCGFGFKKLLLPGWVLSLGASARVDWTKEGLTKNMCRLSAFCSGIALGTVFVWTTTKNLKVEFFVTMLVILVAAVVVSASYAFCLRKCSVPPTMSDDSDINSTSAIVEDSTDKGDKMVIMRVKLIKNFTRLLLVFGFAIVLGMCAVWAKEGAKWVRTENLLTVLGILIGAFTVGVAVAVSASYGFSFRMFFPLPEFWFRVQSREEVLASMPRAYLAFSGMVMLVGIGVMIVGDISIRNNQNELFYNDKDGNFYYVCSAFVATACISFALAMLTSKKPLKILVACFFLSSLAGLLASTYLFQRFGWGLYRFKRIAYGLMLKDVHGSHIKGQDYPSVSMLQNLKFVAAVIIMTFSFFNVFLAATFFVGVKATSKKSSSRLLGFLGIMLIVAGMALEVELDLLISSNNMISGYSPALLLIRSILAISTLLAGIHALHGFYCANNLRKFTLFLLSVIIITSTVFAGIAILRFRSEALEVETAAQTPCRSMNSDEAADSHFCVYNISEAYRHRYKNNDGCATSSNSLGCERCLSDVNEKSPPPLACVPKAKMCDGRADLFIDKVDGRYYSSSISKSK